MIRECRLCGELKDITNFHKSSKGKDGRDTRCSECKNKSARDRRKKIEYSEKERLYRTTDSYKEMRKKKRLENGGYFKAVEKRLNETINKERAGRKYVSFLEAKEYGLPRYFDGSLCKRGHLSERMTSNKSCTACALERARKDENKSKKSDYYYKNRDRLMAGNIKAQRERYQNSKTHKAGIAARNMLKRVLYKGNQEKTGGTYEMLGYTREQLMDRLESQFKDGMSWKNYGDWHIDHIIPVSWFINNDKFDPKEINALSNLQPLWADENFAKGAFVDDGNSK